MRRPLIRIVLAVLLSIIICQVAYILFANQLKKFQTHNTERLTELLMGHHSYKMLFIGSSRTHFGIYPKIIDSVCHTDSYNAGIEGATLYEFEMMLRAYLENHPAPDHVILSLDLHSFNNTKKMFNYPVYLPFLTNRTIKRYMEINGHLPFLKKIFRFLCITDYDDDAKGSIIKALFGKTEIPDGDFQDKGYVSNTSVVVDPNQRIPVTSSYKITMGKKACLDSIMAICKRQQIRVIMMYSPEYRQKIIGSVSNADDILRFIETYASQEKVPFLREDKREICNDPTLFANFGHLNREGAKVYSVILGKTIDSLTHLSK